MVMVMVMVFGLGDGNGNGDGTVGLRGWKGRSVRSMLMTYYRYRGAGRWGCFLEGLRGGRGR